MKHYQKCSNLFKVTLRQWVRISDISKVTDWSRPLRRMWCHRVTCPTTACYRMQASTSSRHTMQWSLCRLAIPHQNHICNRLDINIVLFITRVVNIGPSNIFSRDMKHTYYVCTYTILYLILFYGRYLVLDTIRYRDIYCLFLCISYSFIFFYLSFALTGEIKIISYKLYVRKSWITILECN